MIFSFQYFILRQFSRIFVPTINLINQFMEFKATLLKLSLLLFVSALCAQPPARPAELWAFRSVIDGEPRMLTLKLHKDVTVAYDTENCTLYKVWNGTVELLGAVYNQKHGPQPISTGKDYFINQHRKNAWYIAKNSTSHPAKVQFEGYRFDNGQIELRYSITIDSTTKCTILERPEYVQKNGKSGLERKYTAVGVPLGVQILLFNQASGHTSPTDLVITGNWQTETKTEIFAPWGSYRSETGKLIFTASAASQSIITLFDPRIVQ
jgi:cytochrome c